MACVRDAHEMTRTIVRSRYQTREFRVVERMSCSGRVPQEHRERTFATWEAFVRRCRVCPQPFRKLKVAYGTEGRSLAEDKKRRAINMTVCVSLSLSLSLACFALCCFALFCFACSRPFSLSLSLSLLHVIKPDTFALNRVRPPSDAV